MPVVRRVVPLVLAAALVAGCGSGSSSRVEQAEAVGASTGGAQVAPKSAAFLLRLNTAFDSQAWTALSALLDKFPDGEKLFAGLSSESVDFERDVKPALGPETDVVALAGEDLSKGTFVALTQPKDEAKLDALLAKGEDKSVSEQIEDWRVIADTREAVDAFKQARNGGALADSEEYRAATQDLPGDALATFYLDGSVLERAIAKETKTGTAGPVPGVGRLGWLAGALAGREEGLALDLRLHGDEIEATPFSAELPNEVPAGASIFVDFHGLDATLDELKRLPALSAQLGQATKALGPLIDEVIGLFKGEGAFFARPGPEYTLVLKVADEDGARATLDKLGTLAGAATQRSPEQVGVDGIPASRLSIGNATVYYAVFDGKVVVTNATSAIRALKTGPYLAGSQEWRDAVAAAAMPDETAGIFYADVKQLLPLVQGLSKEPLSVQARRNLEALSTSLLYGSVDGTVYAIKGFISVGD
jgi:hypothetical protein